MAITSLNGKRVLITRADTFAGPALQEVFAELGATVIADTRLLDGVDAPKKLIEDAGHVDILVAHLVAPREAEDPALAVAATDEQWRAVFAHIADPLPRLCRAVLPQMFERQAGKIVVSGSGAALRGIEQLSTYSAARGAQHAYVQALGIELAGQGIQVNAVAPNHVDNPTYLPAEVQADPEFQRYINAEVPLGRLVSGREYAQLVAYLSSDAADCFVGQVFPIAGGWINR